jgi:1-acyl-sn-glycerol-3-phosphate acyltransferase
MLTVAIKSLRLVAHILAGALTLLFRFPRHDAAWRQQAVSRWGEGLLKVLGIRISVRGQAPAGRGYLLAANHVSWLDIHLLHSLAPVRFVSKAEVRDWPLFGWFAEAAGTVFLVREKKSDAMRVNQIMAGHLRAGDCLALFPEGTTTDGRELRPFYPSLFEPAVRAGATVYPVRIRYLAADGRPCIDAAYYADMSLGQSLLRIMRLSGLTAQVEFLPPVQGENRRELAKAAEAAVRATFL